MHNEPVRGFDAESASAELDRQLDQRLIRALETVPAVTIPEGFAAWVAARLPARRPVLLRRTRYGWNVMVVCVAILFAVLVGLALRQPMHSAAGVAIEWVVCGQFVAFVLWLSLRDRRRV